MENDITASKYCHVCKDQTPQYLTQYDLDDFCDNPLMIWYCTRCENNIDFEE